MNQSSKKIVARLIKEGRASKGYTQQELSDLTGISLRSVQRIENEEVLPRAYTMRLLADQLDITLSPTIPKAEPPEHNEPHHTQSTPASPPRGRLNKPRKIILSIGIGVLLILGTSAFIAQSARFPETDFESLLLWMSIAAIYLLILLKLWK